MRQDLRKLIQSSFGKFIIVGSTGFACDAGLTVLFVHAFICGPLLARVLSFAFVSLLCWQMNRRWTFDVAHGAHLGEYGRYLTVNLAAAALNLSMYGLMVGQLPQTIPGTVAAVALGTLAGIGISFPGMRYWVFAPR